MFLLIINSLYDLLISDNFVQKFNGQFDIHTFIGNIYLVFIYKKREFLRTIINISLTYLSQNSSHNLNIDWSDNFMDCYPVKSIENGTIS